MHPGAVTLLASLVACSSSMLEAVKLLRTYARSQEVVAIVGPSGSGKSHLARVLHALSDRPGQLAEVSAGELSDSLAHDQLFGHERGAFTGALLRRHGLFAEAGLGTVLLDDFHLLDRTGQAMLLRVLDAGMYRPLGSDRQVPAQARVIVGSGRDLDELVREGKLLPDLRYRIGFCAIPLAPLAERRDDIGPLAARFLSDCLSGDACAVVALSPDVLPVFEAAPWPGNVRELRAAIRLAHLKAVADRETTIRFEHLPIHLQIGLKYDARSDRATKMRLVAWALWRSGDRVEHAAELIGAHRNTVSALRLELRAREQATAAPNAACPDVQTDAVQQEAS